MSGKLKRSVLSIGMCADTLLIKLRKLRWAEYFVV